MTRERRYLAASVAARLLNQARDAGDPYQSILTAYCFERLLYRVGVSSARDRFVLKGAMLLRLWSDRPYRATRDLDLLRSGEGSYGAVRSDLQSICTQRVVPDAVTFDVDAIRIEGIGAADEYVGTRATIPTQCGTARLRLQVDMGLGDSVWPAPIVCTYPGLLDLPRPSVLAYPREAVIAEKFEAMVLPGDRNSRIKDFFDIVHLARRFEFDRQTLAEAVSRTFARRQTPVPADPPIGLTTQFWSDPTRPAQVRAFTRRAGIHMPEDPETQIALLLSHFLGPILCDLQSNVRIPGRWPPGGPWSDHPE